MNSLEARARRIDLVWGLKAAASLGALLLAFAVIASALRGQLSQLASEGPFILVTYGLAVLLGGTTLGLLRHRMHRWYWRAVVGVVAMLPISLLAGLLAGPPESTVEFLSVALVIAIVGGTLFSVAISIGISLTDRQLEPPRKNDPER